MRTRNLFDPVSGMEKFGSGINIPDPQHWNLVTHWILFSTPAFCYRTFKTDVDPALKPHIQAELEELEEQEENLGILQFLDRLEQVTKTFLNRWLISTLSYFLARNLKVKLLFAFCIKSTRYRASLENLRCLVSWTAKARACTCFAKHMLLMTTVRGLNVEAEWLPYQTNKPTKKIDTVI